MCKTLVVSFACSPRNLPGHNNTCRSYPEFIAPCQHALTTNHPCPPTALTPVYAVFSVECPECLNRAGNKSTTLGLTLFSPGDSAHTEFERSLGRQGFKRVNFSKQVLNVLHRAWGGRMMPESPESRRMLGCVDQAAVAYQQAARKRPAGMGPNARFRVHGDSRVGMPGVGGIGQAGPVEFGWIDPDANLGPKNEGRRIGDGRGGTAIGGMNEATRDVADDSDNEQKVPSEALSSEQSTHASLTPEAAAEEIEPEMGENASSPARRTRENFEADRIHSAQPFTAEGQQIFEQNASFSDMQTIPFPTVSPSTDLARNPRSLIQTSRILTPPKAQRYLKVGSNELIYRDDSRVPDVQEQSYAVRPDNAAFQFRTTVNIPPALDPTHDPSSGAMLDAGQAPIPLTRSPSRTPIEQANYERIEAFRAEIEKRTAAGNQDGGYDAVSGTLGQPPLTPEEMAIWTSLTPSPADAAMPFEESESSSTGAMMGQPGLFGPAASTSRLLASPEQPRVLSKPPNPRRCLTPSARLALNNSIRNTPREYSGNVNPASWNEGMRQSSGSMALAPIPERGLQMSSLEPIVNTPIDPALKNLSASFPEFIASTPVPGMGLETSSFAEDGNLTIHPFSSNLGTHRSESIVPASVSKAASQTSSPERSTNIVIYPASSGQSRSRPQSLGPVSPSNGTLSRPASGTRDIVAPPFPSMRTRTPQSFAAASIPPMAGLSRKRQEFDANNHFAEVEAKRARLNNRE